MGFLTDRCPNCGKSVSKNAEFCNACGCTSSKSWSNCHHCGSSVGSDSKFCWKCGTEQRPDLRKAFYGDRWHRSATDFAARVEIAVPEKTLHHGLQVDDGTLAILFQNGKCLGELQPGYHTFDSFLQRLVGADKGKAMHAVLVDTTAAEVDFHLTGIRCANQIPLDVHTRLLFQVTDVRKFVNSFFKDAATFTAEDLVNRFTADVREAVQLVLAPRTADEIICELRTRELIETDLVPHLTPILAPHGLSITGVRLADFAGPALDVVREKLGEIHRLNREAELNRKLQDALRADKISAFRDEQDLQDAYERITHDSGLKSAERDLAKKRFASAADHTDQLDGLRRDYELRRGEIVNRLDEQKLRHESELTDVRHEIEKRRALFDRDLVEQKARFDVSQQHQMRQSQTDLEVARQGVEALKLVQAAKHEQKEREEKLAVELEAQRLRIRGDASLQALLATVPAEQADRLLKLAELEMRKGLDVEQALAMVAEKSSEIAPAIAQALVARYQNRR